MFFYFSADTLRTYVTGVASRDGLNVNAIVFDNISCSVLLFVK